MFEIMRFPDDIRVFCENENTDAVVRIEIVNRKMSVLLTADHACPEYIRLRWNHPIVGPIQVMGDKWERAYADMQWHGICEDDFMPWYFLATDGAETAGYGVLVQPNSFVSFQCDSRGVTAWFDVRCGARGVHLNGRELLAGIIVSEHYSGVTPFSAAKDFCRILSPSPRLPREPVYGSNNWYYAYGKSSREDILRDAQLLADLTVGNPVRPYMVIDDGWEENKCAGPWDANEKFGNMREIAEEFHRKNLKAGLWFRPLHDKAAETAHPEWRLVKTDLGGISRPDWLSQPDGTSLAYLDPSHPEVKDYLMHTIQKFRNWGFDLIKHDFSTFDMFDSFGYALNGKIPVTRGWSFYDRSKTSAEIVLDFYRLIREAAGDMVIIGCNTMTHLCAGLVEVCRIGDDTSGRTWNRTRSYGINALAFRLCQNRSFYMVDTDCVGILGDHIPWALNRQWLDLLARSGSPLFLSVQPEAVTPAIAADLTRALQVNAIQCDCAEPLDWLYHMIPECWCINGETVHYDFIGDSYPLLLDGKISPF